MKIPKIQFLMNRRANNLLKKFKENEDKYDFLVMIYNKIEKEVLNYKYRSDDYYRNTSKIKKAR